jgi:hypothetical protein
LGPFIVLQNEKNGMDLRQAAERSTKNLMQQRKPAVYKPRAKNPSVQGFLSLQPGQRITIEFESIAADEGDSLTAAVSLCDHPNKQVYSGRVLKVVSVKVNARRKGKASTEV